MPWSGIEPIQIKQFMGDKPEHFPFTQAKVAYDNTAIYVIFRVEDKYVKAVAGKNQGPVYLDSCVEFFFSPEDGIKDGYFNLEMNCGGNMLFHHQMQPRTKQTLISKEHIPTSGGGTLPFQKLSILRSLKIPHGLLNTGSLFQY